MYDVLEGVKVLEVSAWAFVPSGGAVLSDWGADVIKVEPPTGDPMRGLINAGIQTDGPTFVWEIWNRGKRSVALDLRQEQARSIVLELAAEADVFLTSYLPETRGSSPHRCSSTAMLPNSILRRNLAPTPMRSCGTSGWMMSRSSRQKSRAASSSRRLPSRRCYRSERSSAARMSGGA